MIFADENTIHIITKWDHHKSCLWICNHIEANYGVEIFLKCFYNKGLYKWYRTIGVFRIWKHVLGVRKPNESDMGKFNSCGD
jgi:hypothetical protein